MGSLGDWFDVKFLVEQIGQTGPVIAYMILFLIVFTETGLLFGFFLPGDSLLFTAGLACAPDSQLHALAPLNIWLLNLILIPAAILGDTVGYWIGLRVGEPMYKREQTWFFRRDHLLATRDFFAKHGGKTIVLARFVPFMRTFAPVVAGIGQMSYGYFLSFNVFGGIGWIASLSWLGYFLGGIEFIAQHLEAAILLIIFVSVLPVIVGYLKHRYGGKKEKAKVGAADPGI